MSRDTTVGLDHHPLCEVMFTAHTVVSSTSMVMVQVTVAIRVRVMMDKIHHHTYTLDSTTVTLYHAMLVEHPIMRTTGTHDGIPCWHSKVRDP